MRYRKIIAICLCALAVAGCDSNTVVGDSTVSSAKYTAGYAVFWGDFYAEKGVANNVLSMDLYSVGLSVDSAGYYVGSGTNLYISDIFQLPVDTLLIGGTYQMDTTCGAQTFLAGVDYDGRQTGTYLVTVTDMGTSVEVLTDGTFTLSYKGDTTIIDFYMKKSDGKSFTANYRGILYTYDMTATDSVATEQQAIRYKCKR